jgi:hypothetical protein
MFGCDKIEVMRASLNDVVIQPLFKRVPCVGVSGFSDVQPLIARVPVSHEDKTKAYS